MIDLRGNLEAVDSQLLVVTGRSIVAKLVAVAHDSSRLAGPYLAAPKLVAGACSIVPTHDKKQADNKDRANIYNMARSLQFRLRVPGRCLAVPGVGDRCDRIYN